MIKNKLKKFALPVVALAASSAGAFAEEAGTVNDIVTDAGGLLTSIYPIVLGAVGFGILIKLVKMVGRK